MHMGGKSLWMAVAAAVALAGGLLLARSLTPGAQEPGAQEPAAPAQAQAAAPVLPAGATLAILDTAGVASQSKLGQSFAAELEALRERKNKELNAKRQEMQTAQEKLQTDASLTDAARASLQRDIDRMGRELQFATEGAQAEMQNLQLDVQRRFDEALGPILDQVATSRGLQMVFGRAESGLVWADPALDVTAAVVAALDAARPGGQ